MSGKDRNMGGRSQDWVGVYSALGQIGLLG